MILGIDGLGHGQDRLAVALELLVAVVVGVGLVLRQLPQSKPLLPVDLLMRPIFALSVAASVCSFAAQSMAFTSLPFFLVHDLGRSQTETGLPAHPLVGGDGADRASFAGRPVRPVLAGADGRAWPGRAVRRPARPRPACPACRPGG